MQFIESTAFGVRSAYWTLASGPDAPVIHVLPMIHIGDKEFYDEILARASKCDIVLIEGVKSRTPAFLTFSYRYAVRNPKLGLVLQPKINKEDVTGEIVHADVSSADFEKEWARLPLFSRLKLYILFPYYGFYLRYFSTHEVIARHLKTEFAESRGELLEDDDAWEKAKDVILGWRDSHLIVKLGEELENNSNSQKNIAVVYGARHMRAVMKYLIDVKGYRIKNSEWLTVIKL